MLFSERHGYRKIWDRLFWEDLSDDFKKDIWDILNLHQRNYKKLTDFLCKIWNKFYDESTPKFNLWSRSTFYEKIKLKFLSLESDKIYDFMEAFLMYFVSEKDKNKIITELNRTFKQKHYPYRIISDRVTPIITIIEIKEIEKALNIPDRYQPVREHLSKALDKWADIKTPDYENSIKESICAVESLVEILQGKKGTLGDLIENLNIHPAMKKGFKKLYGWSSDDSGIRHGEYGESFPCGEGEARYMLMTCSAFINYVIAKCEKTS